MRALFVFGVLLSFAVFAEDHVFKLEENQNLRVLQGEVLEFVEVLPAGSTLSIPSDTSPETRLYRTASGKIERSSNGFYPHARILSAPLSEGRLEELKKLDLWITVSAIPMNHGATFPALDLGVPAADYLLTFEESGRPKFNLSAYYRTRFPGTLNQPIDPATQTPAEREKWAAIMRELSLAGDRSRATPTNYLFIPLKDAVEASVAYETQDSVSAYGAWTIAVKATAVRHGFPNVPCAEFMSEMIKGAYKRAGYDLFEDFNAVSGTRLTWNFTAAVVNLTNTLYRVGWIPWELAYYRPPTGAIMAHFKATTPGHVYMAAGMDGRLVLDNGSPSGRRLFSTSDKTIKMMYYGGVFFLPPGVVPRKW